MQDIIENILSDIPFFFISFVSIAFALGVILEKKIVRAGLSLVVCFGAVAGAYFAMKAPFVAASQILIYAVGITLVIIFGLMLTSQKPDAMMDPGEIGKNLMSALISVGLFTVFAFSLTGGKWGIFESPLSCPRNTEIIGLKMLSSYVLPFELISVLLLVALIGAVVIAKKDKLEEGKVGE